MAKVIPIIHDPVKKGVSLSFVNLLTVYLSWSLFKEAIKTLNERPRPAVKNMFKDTNNNIKVICLI